MPPVIVWFDLFVGGVLLVSALLAFVRGRNKGSRASRWLGVTFIAGSLCAWFAAGAIMTRPQAAGLWYALTVAASLLTVCSALVGLLRYAEERTR